MTEQGQGEGTKIMAIADAPGLPYRVHVAGALHHERNWSRLALSRGFPSQPLERIIGNMACNSAPFIMELATRGIDKTAYANVPE